MIFALETLVGETYGRRPLIVCTVLKHRQGLDNGIMEERSMPTAHSDVCTRTLYMCGLCCVEAGVNAARDSAKPRMLREYHILL